LYKFSSGEHIPVLFQEEIVGITLNGNTPTKCVKFAPESFSFLTAVCTAKYLSLCQQSSSRYVAHLTRQQIATALIGLIKHHRDWITHNGITRLLEDPLVFPPIKVCPHSLSIFSHEYPALNKTNYGEFVTYLQRFLMKFDWMHKALNFIKISESSDLSQLPGLQIHSLPDRRLCIQVNTSGFPPTSLYSYSITDLCLAVGTTLVALFSSMQALILYWKFKKQHSQNIRSASPLYRETERPLFRQIKTVSFSHELHTLDNHSEISDPSLGNSSFAPEDLFQ
jgi:hypothetical protein